MVAPIKNFLSVPKTMFGVGAISQLNELLDERRAGSGHIVFFVDHYFKDLEKYNIRVDSGDLFFQVDTSEEPKTVVIDEYTKKIKDSGDLPCAVVAFGGGSVLDVGKAVSIMLTNDGSSSDYQGWDLPKNKPVYKVGIPTVSGTGAEVSRTCVLMGPEKKQGINSNFSLYDQIVLDPNLLETVPTEQAFYTAMDCYIHSVESLCGCYLNDFSKAYAEKALDLTRKRFLGDGTHGDMMIASMFGGNSIDYSEVGVCHAMSYGLSYAFGIHHGEGNVIAFDYLDQYYPDYMEEFREMVKKHNITIRRGLCADLSEEMLEKMIDITLLMEKPLENALGTDWRNIFTRDVIKELYLRM